jgi:hypothetical protein
MAQIPKYKKDLIFKKKYVTNMNILFIDEVNIGGFWFLTVLNLRSRAIIHINLTGGTQINAADLIALMTQVIDELNEPVYAIHSDRGGAFRSAEWLEYAKKHNYLISHQLNRYEVKDKNNKQKTIRNFTLAVLETRHRIIKNKIGEIAYYHDAKRAVEICVENDFEVVEPKDSTHIRVVQTGRKVKPWTVKVLRNQFILELLVPDPILFKQATETSIIFLNSQKSKVVNSLTNLQVELYSSLAACISEQFGEKPLVPVLAPTNTNSIQLIDEKLMRDKEVVASGISIINNPNVFVDLNMEKPATSKELLAVGNVLMHNQNESLVILQGKLDEALKELRITREAREKRAANSLKRRNRMIQEKRTALELSHLETILLYCNSSVVVDLRIRCCLILMFLLGVRHSDVKNVSKGFIRTLIKKLRVDVPDDFLDEVIEQLPPLDPIQLHLKNVKQKNTQPVHFSMSGRALVRRFKSDFETLLLVGDSSNEAGFFVPTPNQSNPKPLKAMSDKSNWFIKTVNKVLNAYTEDVKRQTGIECKFRTHSCKTGYISNMYEKTNDIYLVNLLVNHKKIQTTVDYIRLNMSHAQERVKKL